jgi:hypothetical protein
MNSEQSAAVRAAHTWVAGLRVGAAYRSPLTEGELRYSAALLRYIFVGAALEALRRVEVTLDPATGIIRRIDRL